MARFPHHQPTQRGGKNSNGGGVICNPILCCLCACRSSGSQVATATCYQHWVGTRGSSEEEDSCPLSFPPDKGVEIIILTFVLAILLAQHLGSSSEGHCQSQPALPLPRIPAMLAVVNLLLTLPPPGGSGPPPGSGVIFLRHSHW